MPSHPFIAQRSLFKAYDIRGKQALFTPPFVLALSCVFARYLKDNIQVKQVVIGYDMRQDSQAIAEQFAQSCQHAGVEVIWLGMVTTPLMVFWANKYQGHGLITTASHSARFINGIKWVVHGQSPSSEDIMALYHQLATYVEPSSESPKTTLPANLIQLTEQQVAKPYLHSVEQAIHKIRPLYETHLAQMAFDTASANNPSAIQSHSRTDTSCVADIRSIPKAKPLKVVIDCLNGATGSFASSFFGQFPQLCAEVILLNQDPNGQFPKGDPDPTQPHRLRELQVAVIAHQADIGLGFDGDGDRLMVVDNQGRALVPDHLLYLLAQVAVEDYYLSLKNSLSDNSCLEDKDHLNQKPIVIFDVKCAHQVPRLLQQIGAIGQMSKTGSSILRHAVYAKSCQLKNSRADFANLSCPFELVQESRLTTQSPLFAGELSGHFLFNDGYFLLHDDAMYAGLRLLNWLVYHAQRYQLVAQKSLQLTDIINNLPPLVSTADEYLSLSDLPDLPAKALLQDAQALKAEQFYQLSKAPTQQIRAQLNQLCHTLQQQPETLNLNFAPNEQARLSCIDGIRLDFDHGFGIIRLSNTSNSLTVRFAADTLADLRRIQGYFVSLCHNIHAQLAQQIATIEVAR